MPLECEAVELLRQPRVLLERVHLLRQRETARRRQCEPCVRGGCHGGGPGAGRKRPFKPARLCHLH
eukprot:scaffold118899_cov63-Phaeocystis_antarctica.AAC.4